jgi:ribosomal protein S18 acetylase RimI-like enzyme
VKSTALDLLKYGFGGAPLFEALIAEKDGRPVGLCIYFYSFSTWLGEPGLYVQDLYVDSALRGSGLGRRLLHETAKIGREREATHLRLSVDSGNTEAQGFYERVGMHYRAEERIYHVGGEQFRVLAGEEF